MLRPALADPDPVIIFEHTQLYNSSEDLEGPVPVNIDSAAVRREGSHISLITYGGSLPKVLAAADVLAEKGIAAEVVDLRVLRPLDTDTIAASVRKTHRAVVVDEAGAPAVSRRKSWRRSSNANSTSSTRHLAACAAPRSRCPTPSISNTRPSLRSKPLCPRHGM